MSELETALREELRARVAAAEPGEAGAGPDGEGLAGGVERQVRRVRNRRRWTAAALSAVAAAAAIALPLGLLAPHSRPAPFPVGPRAGHHVPLTDTAATPRAWAPVAFGDAQISVPAKWNVETPGSAACGGGARGMVFAGLAPSVRHLRRATGCGLPANVAAIVPASGPVPPGAAGAARMINTIEAFPVHPDGRYEGYLVPSLRVRVLARGPLAARILRTLTRSPLSVVLAGGQRMPVPGSWRWHTFGGIRFAAPGAWPVRRDDLWGGCGTGVDAGTVRLTTAHRAPVMSCPAVVPTAGNMSAIPGVVVGAGRYAQVGFTAVAPRCPLDLHGMAGCVLDTQRGVLTLGVFLPGGRHSIIVEIGLAGNGATARTIVDSVRAR